MAYRTVFIFKDNKCLKEQYEFTWFGGLAREQKQKCVSDLHNSFRSHNPNMKVLEVSSVSEEPLGAALSAMNLTNADGRLVETMYQGSKVFEFGGPFHDMYNSNGFDSKKDTRLKTSGKLLYFDLDGRIINKTPEGLFYNWIWCSTLHQQFSHFSNILEYDAFTDIFFSKGVSCQAEAASIYVTLVKTGWIEEAMKSIEDFSKIIYGTTDIYVPHTKRKGAKAVEVIITNEDELNGIWVNAVEVEGSRAEDEFGHSTVEIYVESIKDGKTLDSYYEFQPLDVSTIVCTLTPEGKFIHKK